MSSLAASLFAPLFGTDPSPDGSPCRCICHDTPGVVHVVACCDATKARGAAPESGEAWPDSLNGADWPSGLDLRDFVFHEGLPPECFVVRSPGALSGLDLFGSFGADGGGLAGLFPAGTFGATAATPAPLKMPPLPRLDSPEGIRNYLAEAWRAISVSNASFGVADSVQAWGRIQALPVAPTSQRMAADVIVAGPLPTTKGADRFYRLCTIIQGDIAKATKVPVIAATPGSMAAAIALQIATAASAQVAAAKASFAKAGHKVTGAAKSAAGAIVNEADKTRAAAVTAVSAVAAIPGTVTSNLRGAVDSVTGIPKSIVSDVTSVPKHLADTANEIAQSYIEAAREVIPQVLPGVTQSLADAAGGIGKGIGTIFMVAAGVTLLIGGGALIFTFGPEIGTAAAVVSRRKK